MKRKHWTFKIISRQFETFSWQDLVGMFNYSVIFSNTSRLGYFSSIFMFQCFQLNGQWQGPAWCLALVLDTAGYSVFTFPQPGPMFEFLHNTDKFLCPTLESLDCEKQWMSRVTCHASPSIPDNCGNVGDMRKCLIHVHNQSKNNRQCPTITILCRGEVWWLLSYSSTRTNIYFLTWKFKLSRDQVIQFGKTDGTEYYSVIIDHPTGMDHAAYLIPNIFMAM